MPEPKPVYERMPAGRLFQFGKQYFALGKKNRQLNGTAPLFMMKQSNPQDPVEKLLV
jgi:hypothetical protein